MSMHPVDLAEERERRERRAKRKFAVACRQAFMHATPLEKADLAVLINARRTNVVSVQDAHETVRALLRTQNERAGARAA